MGKGSSAINAAIILLVLFALLMIGIIAYSANAQNAIWTDAILPIYNTTNNTFAMINDTLIGVHAWLPGGLLIIFGMALSALIIPFLWSHKPTVIPSPTPNPGNPGVESELKDAKATAETFKKDAETAKEELDKITKEKDKSIDELRAEVEKLKAEQQPVAE